MIVTSDNMNRRDSDTFLSWLRQLRMRTVMLIVLVSLVLIPLLVMWTLPQAIVHHPDTIDTADTARRVLGLIDFDHLSGPEIKRRIEELLRIKDSVRTELRGLEEKRAGMLDEIQALSSRIEQLRAESGRERTELERLRVSVEQVKVQQRELRERNTPDIAPPLPLLSSRAQASRGPAPRPDQVTDCSLSSCWDFSRCSVTSRLPVFLYNSSSLYSEVAGQSPHLSSPQAACLYLHTDPPASLAGLASLPHWAGDGRNHLLLLTSTSSDLSPVQHRAVVASSLARAGQFRAGFDVVIPPPPPPPGRQITWHHLPLLVPVVREYLLVFQGGRDGSLSGEEDLLRQERQTVAALQDMKLKQTTDKFSLSFSCQTTDRTVETETSEWSLCERREERLARLREATFCLILPPADLALLSSPGLMTRLMECLAAGSVPVIMSADLVLPFSEVIQWSAAAVILPRQRITELHFLLRTLPQPDIFALKRQGRRLLETYFSSPRAILEALLDLMRYRLSIPGLPFSDSPAPSVFNKTFSPRLMDHLPPEVEPDETLGPLEPPSPSPSFTRNYSTMLTGASHAWNSAFSSHLLPPFTPWTNNLPTEAKFFGSGLGFRPINGGEGGSGHEFSLALGGNSPQEQFTVVMLTYEREQVLINSLARLYGLPYLNKVLVVWNSPQPPSSDLQWPDIGVPIHVVKTEKNSLNNRFLPYEAIETEAVLSVDDDAHLRHDEIIFGFRVWRENRDRLVGFPGRYHAWDQQHSAWNYNSNYSCELSMVLTGAAFYHKYYSYVYSFIMSPDIRDIVDNFVNCEDLAMNFLIAHITRKPPVKVTSRWTFRCPGCPSTLSEDDSHFQERHKCMNLFSQVYGYMPLLYTQYRADSVLFKTRIPPEKQKCFKFI